MHRPKLFVYVIAFYIIITIVMMMMMVMIMMMVMMMIMMMMYKLIAATLKDTLLMLLHSQPHTKDFGHTFPAMLNLLSSVDSNLKMR